MTTVLNHAAGNATRRSVSAEDCFRLEHCCLEALRYEILAWPKPGLVSPVDSGSHRDMHMGTFFASIAALQGSFTELARAGTGGPSFSVLQAIGLQAERKMLCATGGVNTHRGAIFNLGLLVAAAALRRSDRTLAGLTCGAVVARTWGREILAGRRHRPASHGDHVFRKYAAGGARSEAAAGFPTVYSIGLPTLRRLLQAGHDRETALIGTLMAMMEHLPDTNVLWRGGESGLDLVRGSAADFNRMGGVSTAGWQGRLQVLHRAFVARNLSPGGSADLAAATWAAHRIETLHAQAG
ncbi:2-(5''-triphosphoribosyl)-3'-dephosphocoenzyme-A synthase [Sideroxyarcus emersonii]|uniref:triphosphoribosyl-dephospho-CoA synthase n=1 Tax=Sideroxyarcus emersonii TaxID=2764705 RepID=A0AAN1XBI0_9PROT|nr:triphosphoribosyl-dephospho-CoA synthase MdcB [Sideroxyarcus emersonii]BCK88467.1 2-(5''-triphosphoribosyl)-3'-dephosphocoenzyme-A synthase [Sideroxyarcus emersonii]